MLTKGVAAAAIYTFLVSVYVHWLCAGGYKNNNSDDNNNSLTHCCA